MHIHQGTRLYNTKQLLLGQLLNRLIAVPQLQPFALQGDNDFLLLISASIQLRIRSTGCEQLAALFRIVTEVKRPPIRNKLHIGS